MRQAMAPEQGNSALGAVLARQGQVSKGIPDLPKVLTINRNDRSAYDNPALAYLETGAATKALPYSANLQASAMVGSQRPAPNMLEAWARAQAASSETGLALGHLQGAIAQQQDNPVCAMNLIPFTAPGSGERRRSKVL